MSKILQFPQTVISHCNPRELDSVVRFIHQQWHQEYRSLLPEEALAHQTQERLHEHLAPMINHGLEIRQEGALRAYCQINQHTIEQLWVEKSFRRQGLAKRLVTYALELIGRRNHYQAQISCPGFNENGVRFLNALNWQEVSRETKFMKPDFKYQVLTFIYRTRDIA